MTRAEVLVKCHTSHPHALLNIVNHFIVNMARIAAIRRDHNFIPVALVIILMTVIELALPLSATLLLNLWLLLKHSTSISHTFLLFFSTLFSIFKMVFWSRVLTTVRRAKRRLTAQFITLFTSGHIICGRLSFCSQSKQNLLLMGHSFLIPTAPRSMISTLLLLTLLSLRLPLKIYLWRTRYDGRGGRIVLLKRVWPLFNDYDIGIAALHPNSYTSILLFPRVDLF